jgi:hypothetical protein
VCATPTPTPAPAAPARESDHDRGRYNLGSGVYGLITVSVLLAAESSTAETYLDTVVGVALATVLYWLAHAYSELVGWRVQTHKRLTRAGLRETLRWELPILVGAAPPLLAVLIAWAAGASLATAIRIALWTSVVAIVAAEVVAGRKADLSGRDLVIQAGVGAALGLLILLLRLLLH